MNADIDMTYFNVKSPIKNAAASIAIFTSTISAMSTPAVAQSSSPISVSASVDYVSEYVFRGVSFANTAVQPGISVSVNGFTVGAWASTGLGQSSALAGDEIDIYGSYSWSLSDKISASVGATVYHFPQSGDLFDFDSNTAASTFETSAGLSFNTVLSPNVTAYYDFTLDAFTLIGNVSQTVPVANKTSLNLGLTAGFVTAGNGGTDYEWGTANASVNYNVTPKSYVYLGGNFTLNSENLLDFPTANDITPSDNLFWGGVGFSTNF